MKQVLGVVVPPLFALLVAAYIVGCTFIVPIDGVLPVYPGAQQIEAYALSNGQGYVYYFETADQPEVVEAFYKPVLSETVIYRQAPQFQGVALTASFNGVADLRNSPSSQIYSHYSTEFLCFPKVGFLRILRTLRGDYYVEIRGIATDRGETYFEIMVLSRQAFYFTRVSCDYN
jgi:hypothetical protein